MKYDKDNQDKANEIIEGPLDQAKASLASLTPEGRAAARADSRRRVAELEAALNLPLSAPGRAVLEEELALAKRFLVVLDEH